MRTTGTVSFKRGLDNFLEDQKAINADYLRWMELPCLEAVCLRITVAAGWRAEVFKPCWCGFPGSLRVGQYVIQDRGLDESLIYSSRAHFRFLAKAVLLPLTVFSQLLSRSTRNAMSR